MEHVAVVHLNIPLGEIIFEGVMDYGNRKFLAINDGLIEILNHEVSNMGIQVKENTEPNKEAKRYISFKNIQRLIIYFGGDQDILPIFFRVVVEKINSNEVTNVGVVVNDENTDPNIGTKRYDSILWVFRKYTGQVFFQKNFIIFFYF